MFRATPYREGRKRETGAGGMDRNRVQPGPTTGGARAVYGSWGGIGTMPEATA
jgi:hypothetical protein